MNKLVPLALIFLLCACLPVSPAPAQSQPETSQPAQITPGVSKIACGTSGFTGIFVSGDGEVACDGTTYHARSGADDVSLTLWMDAQGYAHWTYSSNQQCWNKDDTVTILPNEGTSAAATGSGTAIHCASQTGAVLIEAVILDQQTLPPVLPVPAGPAYGTIVVAQPLPSVSCGNNTWKAAGNDEFSFTIDDTTRVVYKAENGKLKTTSVVRNQVIWSSILNGADALFEVYAELPNVAFNDGVANIQITMYFMLCGGHLYFDPSYNPNSHMQQALLPIQTVTEADLRVSLFLAHPGARSPCPGFLFFDRQTAITPSRVTCLPSYP